MSVIIHRESAKIIEFPVQPRRRLGGGMTAPVGRYESAVNVIDSCWYHDEAVHDQGLPSDRPKPC